MAAWSRAARAAATSARAASASFRAASIRPRLLWACFRRAFPSSSRASAVRIVSGPASLLREIVGLPAPLVLPQGRVVAEADGVPLLLRDGPLPEEALVALRVLLRVLHDGGGALHRLLRPGDLLRPAARLELVELRGQGADARLGPGFFGGKGLLGRPSAWPPPARGFFRDFSRLAFACSRRERSSAGSSSARSWSCATACPSFTRTLRTRPPVWKARWDCVASIVPE